MEQREFVIQIHEPEGAAKPEVAKPAVPVSITERQTANASLSGIEIPKAEAEAQESAATAGDVKAPRRGLTGFGGLLEDEFSRNVKVSKI